MQQLSLFSNRPARRKPGRNRRHATKKVETPVTLNLWMQDVDQEREMALFFLDIRNFTGLAERHQASDIIHIVKKLFSAFQHIIRVHHGQIIETAGDGFYAAFGFNSDVVTAVNNAVQAGMRILETLHQLNRDSFEINLQRRIEVGIGIHAGKVATGNMVVGNTDHIVVMGYPVNVAARIQTATKELNNNFIISSAVFEKLSASLPDHTKVKATLKGVKDPLDVFLIGESYVPNKQ
ncbi:MAG TPA: adenylate/guanylate cyclase domain-containing protein [Ohtaekwangia sp.]|nr:adenylate/guanylate cyclase domain-containing protein [Ohtaekwangia sp.]